MGKKLQVAGICDGRVTLLAYMHEMVTFLLGLARPSIEEVNMEIQSCFLVDEPVIRNNYNNNILIWINVNLRKLSKCLPCIVPIFLLLVSHSRAFESPYSSAVPEDATVNYLHAQF